MDVGLGHERLAQVQVLFNAMPLLRVQLARREQVDAGARGYGYIGDDEAMVVLWHVGVDRFGKDSEVTVENGQRDDGCDAGHSELHCGSNLDTCQH